MDCPRSNLILIKGNEAKINLSKVNLINVDVIKGNFEILGLTIDNRLSYVYGVWPSSVSGNPWILKNLDKAFCVLSLKNLGKKPWMRNALGNPLEKP